MRGLYARTGITTEWANNMCEGHEPGYLANNPGFEPGLAKLGVACRACLLEGDEFGPEKTDSRIESTSLGGGQYDDVRR